MNVNDGCTGGCTPPPEIPLDDPEFAEVAARWGELSETVRQAILEAIRKAKRQEAEQNGGDVDEK